MEEGCYLILMCSNVKKRWRLVSLVSGPYRSDQAYFDGDWAMPKTSQFERTVFPKLNEYCTFFLIFPSLELCETGGGTYSILVNPRAECKPDTFSVGNKKQEF